MASDGSDSGDRGDISDAPTGQLPLPTSAQVAARRRGLAALYDTWAAERRRAAGDAQWLAAHDMTHDQLLAEAENLEQLARMLRDAPLDDAP